jgi:hypothetical protein
LTEKEDKERHDIFNPKYGERKNFFRKDNMRRLLIIIGVLTVFIWGSRDYIYSYTTDIEVRNRNYRLVDKPFLDKSGEAGYIVINRSPYDVKLEIFCSAGKFQSSYNDTVLIPNQLLYISFKGSVSSAVAIVIRGVKVG